MKNSSSDSADSSVVLRAGDIFVVESKSWLARAIRFVERSRDVGADAKYNHAGIIYSPGGLTFEALVRIRYAHLDDYDGLPVMIGRPLSATPDDIDRALNHVLSHDGELYPFIRLIWHLLGVAHMIRSEKVVCSELAAEAIYFATRSAKFKTWHGYDPAEIACVLEEWKMIGVIYKGKWRKGLASAESPHIAMR
jgi:hypothetical protein